MKLDIKKEALKEAVKVETDLWKVNLREADLWKAELGSAKFYGKGGTVKPT